ncbi:MAG: DUF1573 domain-containing protein [Acidobacteria bacterium]|nr:DUF1573 domain-containing protein [Acidobacteriota bacterium]
MRSCARVLFALVLLVTFAAPCALAEPKAVLPERTFDAGDVEKGTVIEHGFVFRNDGDSDLRILEVHPHCGCTLVDYPSTIPPGGEGVIKAKVNTKNLPTGVQSKTMNVVTDSAELERVVLQIKLKVITAIEFLPRREVYIATQPGKSERQQILVRPHAAGMKILGATSSSPLFSVKLEPAQASSKASVIASPLLPREGDVWVTITVAGDAPIGIHSGEVVIETNDPAHKKESLLVRAAVKEPKKPAANAS